MYLVYDGPISSNIRKRLTGGLRGCTWACLRASAGSTKHALHNVVYTVPYDGESAVVVYMTAAGADRYHTAAQGGFSYLGSMNRTTTRTVHFLDCEHFQTRCDLPTALPYTEQRQFDSYESGRSNSTTPKRERSPSQLLPRN